VSFSISKSFLFLALGKNPAQLWPTYHWSWDENDPVPSNSLSCCLCKPCPRHASVGVFGKTSRGRTKSVGYRPGAAAGTNPGVQQRGACTHTGPVCPESICLNDS